MFSTGAFTFKRRAQLAISLALIGGYTNVVTFLACNVYTSHVTGTVTSFGRLSATGDWRQATFFLFIILCFLGGAMITSYMSETARRHERRSRYADPITIEVVALLIFAIGIEQHDHVAPEETFSLYWLCGIASLAMGIQNAVITRISGSVVRTTHLTGIVTDLGLEGVSYLMRRSDPRMPHLALRKDDRRALRAHASSSVTPQRLALLGSILVAFTIGVFTGTTMFAWRASLSMLPPVALLIVLVVFDHISPIATLRAVGHGVDPSTSDRQTDADRTAIAIYRAEVDRSRGIHRAPNFALWSDHVERESTVAIVMLEPEVDLDLNACLDLLFTREALWSRGQRLLLAGVSVEQFDSLSRNGVVEVFGIESIGADLDAILELARTWAQSTSDRS